MKRATAVIYLDQHIKSLPEIIKNKACKNVVNVKGTAAIYLDKHANDIINSKNNFKNVQN